MLVDALPEGAFAAVMATAIVSRASRPDLPGLAAALLWLAVAELAVIAVVLARGRSRRSGAWWDVATFVAAAAALAIGLRAAGDAASARACAVAAFVGWLWIASRPGPWVPAAAPRRPGEASGRRLLAVVATQSAVISLGALVVHPPAVMAGVVLAVWAAAIVLYVPMMAPIVGGMVDRARAARFRPDDWIAMGALAISALAGTTLIGSAGGGIRPGIRTISLGVWAGACLWVPLLVRLDVRAALAGRRRLPDAHRWSMVFPLGMLSAASQAVGDAETLPAVRQVGQGVMWVALIAWAMVAAGCLADVVRAAGVSRGSSRNRPRPGPRARPRM